MTKEPNIETINIDAWKKLLDYNKPSSFSLQSNQGNGCFLDPPGYPTYFTRSIYTKQGNEPSTGPSKLLFGKVIESRNDWDNANGWDEVSSARGMRFRKLWKPLPIDHPRTVAWIQALYRHMQHCYHNKDSDESDQTLIYPIPGYNLKSFVDDVRFSDLWRIKERAAIDQANTETMNNALKIAIPENHNAVMSIRRYYPEYEPDLELIKNPPKSTPTWWERLSECPTPETCPGGMGRKHPLNGSWCQVCGWSKNNEDKE